MKRLNGACRIAFLGSATAMLGHSFGVVGCGEAFEGGCKDTLTCSADGGVGGAAHGGTSSSEGGTTMIAGNGSGGADAGADTGGASGSPSGGASSDGGTDSGGSAHGGAGGDTVGGSGGADGNACASDCLGGECVAGACQPLQLAELSSERVRGIGLSPNLVLVSSDKWDQGGAAIYAIDKTSGAAEMIRPRRTDGSFSLKLWATASTLVSLDFYQAAGNDWYLSHCSLPDCGDAMPALGSHMPNSIVDFAVDTAKSRVYFFEPVSREIKSTVADTWAPTTVRALAAGAASFSDGRAVAFANDTVYVSLQDFVAKTPADGSAALTAVCGHPATEDGGTIQRMQATSSSLVLKYSSGSLYRAPLPAGIVSSPPDVISGPTGVKSFVIWGSTLFWSGSSSIYACSLPLCDDRRTVVADEEPILDLAVDGAAIYWITESPDYMRARVMRLAR